VRSVVGIGNPLMDFIMHSDFSMVERFTQNRGTMHLVERELVDSILEKNPGALEIPGGSCANTLRGVAWCLENDTGNELPAYIGAVGRDAKGDSFHEMLLANGVEPFLARKETPTGVSGILVTPDHERTMFTYLGACRELNITDLESSLVCGAEYLYMAGFMWDTENQKQAAMKSIVEAGNAGVKIAFDLADPFVVCRYEDDLKEWLPGHLDVLFANREELAMMTGFGFESPAKHEVILEAAAYLADIVVMKIGAEGCMILHQGDVIAVPGEKVDPLDTTGAGDSFAGGFLYGLLTEESLYRCGAIANKLASRIVTVEGCNYNALDASFRKSLSD